MNRNLIFTLSILGILCGLVSAFIFGREKAAQPPAFTPTGSPFSSAIFANGIVESEQSSGSNTNMYPEVPGTITHVLVHEGQHVAAGTLIISIDDSIQASATEQFRLQSEAALATLLELQAQPRQEVIAVVEAQDAYAKSTYAIAHNQYIKRRDAFLQDRGSISRDLLDTAQETSDQAQAGVEVTRRQLALARAGAWAFDIDSQRKQCEALTQQYRTSKALLLKYSIVAPVDGVILSISAGTGSYASSQGIYNPYTQTFDPLVILGTPQQRLEVRCYVDEILVSRLPAPGRMRAQMAVRGSDIKVSLDFVRIQPYISPKIELSNQRQERVDLRVLPVVFSFIKGDTPVYPGQLVDVFIGQQ